MDQGEQHLDIGRRGRPKMVDQSEQNSQCHQIHVCQQALLTYMHLIGLPKSIVFKEKQRQILIAESQDPKRKKNVPFIEWKANCQWNKQDELVKSKSILQKYFQPKQKAKKLKLNEMVEFMTQLSDIYCEQATNQLYKVLSKVLLSVAHDSQINVGQLWNDLIFLSRKFTGKEKMIKYYFDEKHPQEQQKFQYFKQLIKSLKESISKVCEDPTQWRAYCRHHQDQDEKLKQIANR